MNTHTRVVETMVPNFDGLDSAERNLCFERYARIRSSLADIYTESHEKVEQLIVYRRNMERNLAEDSSRWDPEYVTKIRQTIDRQLTMHSATLQKLVIGEANI